MKYSAKLFSANVLRCLHKGQNLNRTTCSRMIQILLKKSLGSQTDFVLGAFLGLLGFKKPTKEELDGLVEGLMNFAEEKPKFDYSNQSVVVAVGSGKDEFKTINVTTPASFVAACCGAKVIKVGCRAESSVAGVTDVLENLGFNTRVSFSRANESLQELRFGFFNPEFPLPELFDVYIGKSLIFNPLEYVMPLFLGVRTKHLLYGLADPHTELTADLFYRKGNTDSLIVCGKTNEGLCIDEMSNLGPTIISKISHKGVETFEITPVDVGLEIAKDEEVQQPENLRLCAQVVRDILKGEANKSQTELVALNAGGILWISGIVDELHKAVLVALNCIKSGAPWNLFQLVKEYSKK